MSAVSRPLVVGVTRERKPGEQRVALTPDGAHELASHGVTVLVERGAGEGSRITDDDFGAAGAQLVEGAEDVWARADLIVKVKEPQPTEFVHLRPGLVLFTYLHLAAYPQVADELLARGVIGIAYETVEAPDGSLPLLAPMSEVAGRMAAQVGAHFLERPAGGRGILLGGVPGVAPARVAVLGAGHVGWSAGRVAAGMGADVVMLNRGLERLREIDEVARGRVATIASSAAAVQRAVLEADLVVGAVLVPGGRAPVLVTEDLVRAMKPGAVIVDVAVDQGGCVATTHETSHADPVYEVHGVLHYAVGNMPGAVPHTSTYALTSATLPHVVALATRGVREAVAADPGLARGCNTWGGQVTHPAVAEALGRPYTPLDEALAHRPA